MLLRAFAPAKINLSLHVGPPKANGRHDLISLVVFADDSVADELSTAPAHHFSLAVNGPFAKAAGPAQDNLVLKAARALTEQLDNDLPRLAFSLTKNLPCAAGIGGGSADAAAALRLMVKAHGGETARAAALKAAPVLGGDVLSCFYALPGLMQGEGEIFEPMLSVPPLPALLVNPGVDCPTGPIFRAYDMTAPAKIADHPAPPAGRARAQDFVEWLQRNTQNDLQAVAIKRVPIIKTVLDHLGGLPEIRLARMSGSGATCFGLFPTLDSSEKAREILQAAHPDWWVKSTLLGRGV